MEPRVVLNPERDAGLLTLGADTAGAVHLDQCRAAGMSDRKVHQLVNSGRWQSPFPRVFVTFSGPIPPVTLHHAALMYAGDGAALSHETAGWLWRLCKRPLDIHLTIPYGRRVNRQPGLAIHRSRSLSEADVHPALSPRRNRIERTVIDLLAHARNGEAALSLVSDSIRGRRTTPARLREALDGQPHTRWRGEVIMALPDISAGAHSLLEIKDTQMRRSHGLPTGQRQFTRDGNGAEHLDVLIEEYRLHVELDGRLGHDRAVETWRDHRRDNRSVVGRLLPLRYGWADMIDRGCEVAAEQAEVLRRQGWPGELRRCKRCPPEV